MSGESTAEAVALLAKAYGADGAEVILKGVMAAFEGRRAGIVARCERMAAENARMREELSFLRQTTGPDTLDLREKARELVRRHQR